MNTHYAVIAFGGDPAGEHPAEDLNGQGPLLQVIASGPEEFCWDALTRWTAINPLRMWEEAEVLRRDPVVAQQAAARAVAASRADDRTTTEDDERHGVRRTDLDGQGDLPGVQAGVPGPVDVLALRDKAAPGDGAGRPALHRSHDGAARRDAPVDPDAGVAHSPAPTPRAEADQ